MRADESIVTGAVDTGAAWTALAIATLRSSFHHHEGLHRGFLGHNNVSSIAASLLHALALVSAVAVSALVRHGEKGG